MKTCFATGNGVADWFNNSGVFSAISNIVIEQMAVYLDKNVTVPEWKGEIMRFMGNIRFMNRSIYDVLVRISTAKLSTLLKPASIRKCRNWMNNKIVPHMVISSSDTSVLQMPVTNFVFCRHLQEEMVFVSNLVPRLCWGQWWQDVVHLT